MAYNKKYAELGDNVLDYVNNREDAIEQGFNDVDGELENLETNKADKSYVDTRFNSIVESGSNENGNWVKFADGTQICWYNGTIALAATSTEYGSLFTGAETWTFPMAFATSNVVVSVGLFRLLTGASWGSVGTPPTPTSVSVRYFDIASRVAGSSASVGFFAIGRWK